jgi:DNA invertase Pin-like site-specific DNA recombinase
VAYYRVSTQQQGSSGLGLEAQRAQVGAYLNGGRWSLLGEFTEVETGKGSNALDRRPQLRAALELARKRKATLVIAKLDRLARNVHFVSGLIESGVDFVAADMPQANKVMIQMHAVMSEWERDAISKRTRDALAAAKARGVKLATARPGPSEARLSTLCLRCAPRNAQSRRADGKHGRCPNTTGGPGDPSPTPSAQDAGRQSRTTQLRRECRVRCPLRQRTTTCRW